MNNLVTKTLWTFVFSAAMLTTIMVGRYLTFDPEVYFPQQKETYLAHRGGIYLHIIGGMVALFLGPFQFNAALRRKWLTLHRLLGRIYVAGALAGGLGGLYMAQFAHGGFPSSVGFGMLAVIWLACTAVALQRILAQDIVAHREWMVRSFVLTLAAFTLRMWLTIHGILTGTEVIDLSFTSMYVAVAWLCWVPNLIAGEIYINLMRKSTARVAA